MLYIAIQNTSSSLKNVCGRGKGHGGGTVSGRGIGSGSKLDINFLKKNLGVVVHVDVTVDAETK